MLTSLTSKAYDRFEGIRTCQICSNALDSIMHNVSHYIFRMVNNVGYRLVKPKYHVHIKRQKKKKQVLFLNFF